MARPRSGIATRIADAALDRFLLEGVDGASLRSIALDAGTNIGMVYYYFKTKDELFAAVIEHSYAELLAGLTRALSADRPPEQRIAQMYERLAAMDEREFKVVRLILREALISSARLRRVADRFARGHVPLVMQTLADGARTGRFDARAHPAALAIATAALAVMPQVLHRLLSDAELPIAATLPSREQASHALYELLLFGIAGPALDPRKPTPQRPRTPVPAKRPGRPPRGARTRKARKPKPE